MSDERAMSSYNTPCTNFAHIQSIAKYAKVSVFGYLKSIERWQTGIRLQLDPTEETDELTYLKIIVEDPLSSYRKTMIVCIFGIHKKEDFTTLWSKQKLYIGHLIMMSNFKKNDKGVSGEATEMFVRIFSPTDLEIGENQEPSNSVSISCDGNMCISDIKMCTHKCTVSMREVFIDSLGASKNGKPYATIRQGMEYHSMYMWAGHPDLEVGSTYDLEGLQVTPVTNTVLLAISTTSKAKLSTQGSVIDSGYETPDSRTSNLEDVTSPEVLRSLTGIRYLNNIII